ncbi:hypothetical protein FIBSPDRAFT_531982 [Athelia psychrophila]|uniref:Uncharacterized protein n=1 Tax=Athelia psychrophila TaxID=1759441 RepID=A0A167TI82_9AGAM|nr:hypothetical protein FIBSPDRAFT_531982 [Fibularhizoctonia sp. CBS 109695]
MYLPTYLPTYLTNARLFCVIALYCLYMTRSPRDSITYRHRQVDGRLAFRISVQPHLDPPAILLHLTPRIAISGSNCTAASSSCN